MDCRSFRRIHLSYLDDTLPGDAMSAAQRHLLACDGCAAHDTLVRRSLMLVRNLPELEPSAEFRARLDARLAVCRAAGLADQATSRWPGLDESAPLRRRVSTRVVAVATLGVVVIGTLAWSGDDGIDPVTIPPAPVAGAHAAPPITPELVQAMATGNPMWPATVVIDDATAQFVSVEQAFGDGLR